jgi:hypothetical protein
LHGWVQDKVNDEFFNRLAVVASERLAIAMAYSRHQLIWGVPCGPTLEMLDSKGINFMSNYDSGAVATLAEEDVQIIWSDQEQQPKGAWFVYAYDVGAYPIALFDEEIEALRYVMRLGYGKVIFWEFGKNWDELEKR